MAKTMGMSFVLTTVSTFGEWGPFSQEESIFPADKLEPSHYQCVYINRCMDGIHYNTQICMNTDRLCLFCPLKSVFRGFE